MLDLGVLTELGRQRQRAVAHDVALCRHVRSPRVVVGQVLVALGALVVCIGTALDEDSERKSEIPVA
jgi:hypothetical protein